MSELDRVVKLEQENEWGVSAISGIFRLIFLAFDIFVARFIVFRQIIYWLNIRLSCTQNNLSDKIRQNYLM